MRPHDEDAPLALVPTGRFLIFPQVSRPVFIISASVILALIAFAAVFTGPAEAVFAATQAWITDVFGWFYVLVVTLFLVFVVYLAFSRYGPVRLGDAFESPRFTLAGWFAMLFSAGMGIGLLFWSVAEPMYHYLQPPTGGAPDATEALRYTFYHWGLHAWSVYCVVGLAIGYFAYRQKLPITIRSAFYPLLGERIYGPIGHAIDSFAIFGTMFGVATSLGFGVLQINSGLDYLLGIGESAWLQVAIIAFVTLLATGSVLLGLSKGIQRLSQFNIALSVALLLFVLVAGPTLFLLRFLVEGIGDYVQHLPGLSLWNDAVAQSGWQDGWTIFYWGWWISWAPFVGMFIARVSRGRTIREFVAGALVAPTLAGFVWLTVLGGTGLEMQMVGGVDLAAAVEANVATAIFVMLDHLPFAAITATLTTALVVTYFVTSSDSGSLVIDMLAAGGHTDPPKIQRVFWAVTEGAVAAVLLVVGGLGALQAASIAAGLPFAVIMVFMCIALMKALRTEPITPDAEEREPEAPDETMGDVQHDEPEDELEAEPESEPEPDPDPEPEPEPEANGGSERGDDDGRVDDAAADAEPEARGARTDGATRD
ncbi:MAG: BCCT family transporter [Trueperaceae bacterium]|nr:MAG: BCCT family transporter [Trueperaceae bacterium]